MRLYAHQDPKTETDRHERSSPVTDERQRHAHHGQDAAHHAHVDERIGEKRERDGAGEEPRKEGGRVGGDDHAPGDGQQENQQQHQVAEQPELLRVNRKDEVGRAFRNEIKVSLRSFQPALADETSGADRDGRLYGVISGAERILRRVDEREDALTLVIVQHRPHQRQACGARDSDTGDDLPRQPGEKQHVASAREDEHGRSQVRLARDERDRHRQQHRGNHVMPDLERRLIAVEIPRQHERHRDLHQLGRLYAREPDVQPAPGAVHDLAGQRHAEEQRDPQQIGRQRQSLEVVRRDVGDHPHHGQRDQHVHELRAHARDVCAGRAVEHHQAGHHQCKQRGEQKPVDMSSEEPRDAPNQVRHRRRP